MAPRALLLAVVVAFAGCTGPSYRSDPGDDDPGPRSGTAYFQHVSSCGAGTCGAPVETSFDVPAEAERLALQIVIASGATGAVRVEIKDPDGVSVYAKTLTPGASQTFVDSTTLPAEAGRWSYSEAYISFSGTLSISVNEQ